MPHISQDIETAVQSLQTGFPVALPTETVYGLAANAQNETAIKAVFDLKKRPLDHPLILHVAPEWDLGQWVKDVPKYAKQLISAFWPGPLTVVFNCNNKIPALVRGGQDSIAIRCPNHPVFLQCLRHFGGPLVAPSANPFGKVSPTTANHVAESFVDSDLLIIDGGRCSVGIESTIIDARSNDGFRILRHGIIKEADIYQVVDAKQMESDDTLRVSGHLKMHYQPEKPLITFSTDAQRQTLLQQYGGCLFVIDYAKPDSVEPGLFFKWPDSPEIAAYELYYQLRSADKSEATVIAMRLPPDSKDWSAIRERVIKASHNPPSSLDS